MNFRERCLEDSRNGKQGIMPRSWWGNTTYAIRRRRQFQALISGKKIGFKPNRNAYRVTY